MRWTCVITIGLLVVSACGDEADPVDSGVVDSGGGDSGTPDTAVLDSGDGDTAVGDSGEADSGGPDSGVDASAPAHNVVFVTSSVHTGVLGGLAGADGICAARAAEAGLVGTFVAWLSTSETNAIDRLGEARGFIRPDGRVVADEAADLAAGRFAYPIRLDENGRDVGDAAVRTGTELSGVVDRSWPTPCADWTATEGRARGGRADSALAWTSGVSTSCDVERHLYCVQIDLSSAATPTAVAGRVGFLGSTAFVPGSGGVDAADALCQADADAAGLSGSFLALLAPTGGTAASRFDDGPPWVRVDGVSLADSAAEFFTVEYWHAPLAMHADGSYQDRSYVVANGAPSMDSAGEDALNCTGWTSTSGTAHLGSPLYSRVSEAFGDAPSTQNCNRTSLRLYCLEN